MSSSIRAAKLTRLSQAGYKTHILQIRNAYKILAGSPEGKKPSWRTNVYRRAILNRILNIGGEKMWTAFVWFQLWKS